MSVSTGLSIEQSPGASRPVTSESVAVTSRAVGGAEWDAIVSGFDGVCQEQLFGFASIRWPGVVAEPRVFEHRGRVVGGALVMIQNLPLRLARIAVVKWGPILASARASGAAQIYAGMVEALMAEYARERGMMLSILPHASPLERNEEYRALKDRGFKRGAVLGFPNRYMVNLRLSDEDQRKSFGQTWRRQLNKADKSDLTFERAGADRLEDFKNLYAAMSDRKHFPDHSAFETVDALMAMDQPLRPELFFVRQQGALVAGALIFKAGDRAVYLYGATNDQALPLRAGYFLHWQIIRWLRDNTQATWYDLGGTDGFHGLHQFKKGMVGDAGQIRPVPPVANYAARPLPYILGVGAFAARELLHGVQRQIDRVRPGGARPDQKWTPMPAEFQ